MTLEEIDAIGLIREAYRIDGIGAGECRSIFLDWALRLPAGCDHGAAVALLLETYGSADDHPMTAILTQAQVRTDRTGRRGGFRGRRS